MSLRATGNEDSTRPVKHFEDGFAVRVGPFFDVDHLDGLCPDVAEDLDVALPHLLGGFRCCRHDGYPGPLAASQLDESGQNCLITLFVFVLGATNWHNWALPDPPSRGGCHRG